MNAAQTQQVAAPNASPANPPPATPLNDRTLPAPGSASSALTSQREAGRMAKTPAEASVKQNTPAASEDKQRIPWNDDAEGPGQPTSLDILITWLSDANNYARLKGANGSKRVDCTKEISELIKAAKTKAERSPDSVSDKIRQVVKQFAAAEEFLNATGQGILDAAADKDDPAHYEREEKYVMEKAYKICPFYEALSPVLKDRAGTRSKFSHGTGDGADRAAEMLQSRAEASLGNKDDQAEEFYDGWVNSDEERGRARTGGSAQSQVNPPASAPSQEQGSQAAAGASGNTTGTPAPAASAAGAAPQPAAATTSGGKPANNANKMSGTSTGGEGKTIIGGRSSMGSAPVSGNSSKGKNKKKRMSAVEEGINVRGEKRLKVDIKAKEMEMKRTAFKDVNDHAMELMRSTPGLSRREALQKARKEYQEFFTSWDVDLLGGSSSKAKKEDGDSDDEADSSGTSIISLD
ncbi:hypothetical protein CF326_g7705 [Tilletia indica]|nr:hypothetical protein CF326_g7705 [Tilletia indica]